MIKLVGFCLLLLSKVGMFEMILMILFSVKTNITIYM
jgi:hypothetical protein